MNSNFLPLGRSAFATSVFFMLLANQFVYGIELTNRVLMLNSDAQPVILMVSNDSVRRRVPKPICR